MPPHRPRWQGVSGEHVKRMACAPPVEELEASFVRFVESSTAR